MTLVPLTGQLQAIAERFKFVVIGLFDLTGAGPDQGGVLQPLEFHHPQSSEHPAPRFRPGPGLAPHPLPQQPPRKGPLGAGRALV